MDLKQYPRSVILLASLLLLLLGMALITWLVGNVPAETAPTTVSAADHIEVNQATDSDEMLIAGSHLSATIATETAAPVPITVGIADGVPYHLLMATQHLSNTTIITGYRPGRIAANQTEDHDSVALHIDFARERAERDEQPIEIVSHYDYTFAAATRFDTIDPTIAWSTIQRLWGTEIDAEGGLTETDSRETEADVRFTAIAILTETLPALTTILGSPGATVTGYDTVEAVNEAAWGDRTTLALIPFEQLTPRFVVLAIDGQTPVENANKFESATYPLVAKIEAELTTDSAAERNTAEILLASLPASNRDPTKLTVIAMTGVTAMVRLTAAEMDKRGNGWPAEIIGPELSLADITVISNEVPFVPGCETNTDMRNLTFCSDPAYVEALTAVGVDIIGLTGNHQNDYGRENALISLDIYAEAGLPVYGGGRNKEEAFAPLYLEHNGNRLAFLGANSYGPQFAWATDDQPGSAEFDLNIMSATIRNIKEHGRAKVVLAELQYQETYNVIPLIDQRQTFNALIRAGADIVTGIQSHVPQAMELTDGKLILYGLGNLYFDQMWSQQTREGLIVKHTIYDNRHISTQVLTTLIYDYGQPQWTTPSENRAILGRVFGASYW